MNEGRKGVPAGASAVIPRLFCRSPADEVEFCVATFQAEERVRRPGPDGTLAHALITIGGAMVMIEAEWPEAPNRSPAADGSTPVALYVYVENVDQTVERAVSRGAKLLMAAADQPWGDRIAWFIDPDLSTLTNMLTFLMLECVAVPEQFGMLHAWSLPTLS